MSFRNRSKNFTKKNFKLLLISSLLTLLVIGGVFVIRTSAQTTNTTYFTGCLDVSKGDFYNFNLGSTPLKTCKSGDTQVNWNNASYSAGQGLSLNGNQFSVIDQGITTAKIADNAVTLAKLASQTKTQVWSQTTSGSTNSITPPTAMATLTVNVTVPSKIFLTVTGDQWSDTADWTYTDIEKNGTNLLGLAIDHNSNNFMLRQPFSSSLVDNVTPGTYTYTANIAPTGSAHYVHWESVSFTAIAFPN